MKKFLLTTAIAMLPVTGAMAGSLADPVIATAPTMPAAAGSIWDGFYLGATGGYNMGDTLPAPAAAFEGMTYGAFFGYNHVMDGGFMLGAEVAGTMANMNYAVPPNLTGTIIDAKLRAGFDLGNALVFVSGGYTMATYSDGSEGNGWNIGAGVDYMVTDRFFIGGEYVYRDITDSLVTPATWQDKVGTIQVRAGIKF